MVDFRNITYYGHISLMFFLIYCLYRISQYTNNLKFRFLAVEVIIQTIAASCSKMFECYFSSYFAF